MSKSIQSPHFNIDDYIDKQVNMLTVIGIAERLPSDNFWYLKCKCKCGNVTRITPSQFNRKCVKSCGCLRRNGTRTIDNRSNHPLYGIWSRMIDRCENPKDKKYEYYGGRGITVCDEWHNFFNFVKWSDSVGGRPEGFTLDRINNDGNYEPSNCRWATRFQQSTNKSSNIVLDFNGESKTLVEWSISTGIKWYVLWNRYKSGWSVEKILSTPPKIQIPSSQRPSIVQCDINGNEISIYKDPTFIPPNFRKDKVIYCCEGKRKTHMGYIWEYADA